MRKLAVTIAGLGVAAAVLAPSAAHAEGYCWTPGHFQHCIWLPIRPA